VYPCNTVVYVLKPHFSLKPINHVSVNQLHSTYNQYSMFMSALLKHIVLPYTSHVSRIVIHCHLSCSWIQTTDIDSSY